MRRRDSLNIFLISLLFFLLLPLYFFPFIRPEILKPVIAEEGILIVTFYIIIREAFIGKFYLPSKPIFYISLFSILYFSLSSIHGLRLSSHPEGFLPFFYLIFLAFFLFEGEKENILEVIVYIALLVSLLTIWEKFIGIPGTWKYKFPEKVSIPLGNPNRLGAYLAVVFPFSLYKKEWRYFISPVIFSSLILSSSQGAYISLLAGFLLWSFFYYPKRRIFSYIGFLLLFLALFFFLRYLPPHSFYWRIFHWKVGWRIFLKSPIIGSGISGVFKNYSIFQEPLRAHFPFPPPSFMERYLHNDFLQLLCEEGIFGFLLFYIIIFLILKNYIKVKRMPENLISLSLLIWLMLGFLSFPLYIPSATLVVFLTSAIYLKREEMKLNPKLKFGFMIFSVLLIIPVFYLNKVLIGEYHFRKGIFYLEKGRKEKGVKEIKKSEKFNSLNPFLYYSMAVLEKEEGNRKKALKYAKRALSLGLRHPKLKELIEELDGNE